MRRRSLLAVAVLALVLGGAAWRYDYLRSPAYSLKQAGEAVRARDVTAFREYVDVERTSRGITDGLVDYVALRAGEGGGGEGGLELLASTFVMALVQSLEPLLASAVEEGMVRAVETGEVSGALPTAADGGGEVDPAALLEGTGADRGTFEGLGEVEESGDRAVAALRFRYEALDTTLALRVEMERAGSRWRVVGVRGLDRYLEALDGLQAERGGAPAP